MKKKDERKIKQIIISIILLMIIGIVGIINPIAQSYLLDYLGINKTEVKPEPTQVEVFSTELSFDLDSIPEYTNKPYVCINENKPFFTEKDYTTKPFENYSDLDVLGRCGVAYANICREIMPKQNEKRGAINNVYPSGWKNVKYDCIKDGQYVYNRAHLIGWQLAGENDNPKNLITGTRYMNTIGMLPFENMVDDYFEEDENLLNHVLYRVTPIFEGTNLVASGVEMEAYSVEDNGQGVCFNVYIYNVQPDIEINYATGESKLK